MNKAVFFEIDGVIVKTNVIDGKPVFIYDKVDFVDGIIDFAEYLKDVDFYRFGIENCPDLESGFVTSEQVNWKCRVIFNNIDIVGFYICSHKWTGLECECCLPQPKFILEAQKEWNLDLNESWVIGNRYYDIEVAKKLGMKSIFVDLGYNERVVESADYVVENVNGIKEIFERIYGK